MISGIINLKKEAGMTSHDAVFKLRKILKEKKIGHGGTLDPDVTGVLPIALGKATRMIEYMQEEGKVYEGEILLGFSTTTEDASGQVVEVTPVTVDITEKQVDAAMATFVGEIIQIPPMYSAVKVNGRKLYEYARANEEVERPERQVSIYEFVRTSELIQENETVRFSFLVRCGKGTYVRTLAVDVGRKLGYASHMSRLERTMAGGMKLEEALTISDIADRVEEQDFSFLRPIEEGIGDLSVVELTAEQVVEVQFGRQVCIEAKEKIVAAFHNDKLIGILERRDKVYKPRKVFL